MEQDEAPAQAYRFIATGRVQGVGFRQATAEKARHLGLNGWVRNLSDGRVEGLAVGSPDALLQMQSWLEHGPPIARVTQLQWLPAAVPASTDRFEIRPSGSPESESRT